MHNYGPFNRSHLTLFWSSRLIVSPGSDELYQLGADSGTVHPDGKGMRQLQQGSLTAVKLNCHRFVQWKLIQNCWVSSGLRGLEVWCCCGLDMVCLLNVNGLEAFLLVWLCWKVVRPLRGKWVRGWFHPHKWRNVFLKDWIRSLETGLGLMGMIGS